MTTTTTTPPRFGHGETDRVLEVLDKLLSEPWAQEYLERKKERT
jgi:hypothetical protein